MTSIGRFLALGSLLCLSAFMAAGQQSREADSSKTVKAAAVPTQEPRYGNLWGLDVLVSNDGFGLGGFYRRQLTPDISGFVTLSVSEAKDDREVERFDPYFQISYIPGKLNRFLVLPLMVGIQYRLFREEITETFRPFVNAGAGPAMIYQMPFVSFTQAADGTTQTEQVDFFKAIGRGRAHYTASAFIGFGANFGTDVSSVFGVNFRYYFTYLYSGGLPSLYNTNSGPGFGSVSATKKNFGGFVITLTIGMGY